MSTKPTVLPEWDTSSTNLTTPSAGYVASGYSVGDPVPSGYLNYHLKHLGLWAEYVRDAAFTATSGNGASGQTTDAFGSGLLGDNVNGTGVTGTGLTGGSFSGTQMGLVGSVNDVLGYGVYGVNSAEGFGICGESQGSNPNSGVLGKVNDASTNSKSSGVRGVSAARANATYTAGVYGEFLGGGSGGDAAGVIGDGSAGAYGVVARGDATTPVFAALRIEPQDTAPTAPLKGDLYVNTGTGKLMIYDGAAWVVVGSQS